MDEERIAWIRARRQERVAWITYCESKRHLFPWWLWPVIRRLAGYTRREAEHCGAAPRRVTRQEVVR